MRKEETPGISLPSLPHGCVEDTAVCKQGERSHQKAPLRQAPGGAVETALSVASCCGWARRRVLTHVSKSFRAHVYESRTEHVSDEEISFYRSHAEWLRDEERMWMVQL